MRYYLNQTDNPYLLFALKHVNNAWTPYGRSHLAPKCLGFNAICAYLERGQAF